MQPANTITDAAPFTASGVRFTQTDDACVAYLHSIGGVVHYAGYCRLTELFRAPDAHRNVVWRAVVMPSNEVEVMVTNTFYGEHAMRKAMDAARAFAKQFNPVCNINAQIVPSKQVIKCVETGQVFQTAAEVCKLYGMHASNFSVYLNRAEPGAKIKGLTFVKVME